LSCYIEVSAQKVEEVADIINHPATRESDFVLGMRQRLHGLALSPETSE
jgi:hypothetical protein